MTIDAALVLLGCGALVLSGLATMVAVYFAIRRDIRQEGLSTRDDLRQEFRRETARLVAALTSHEHDEQGKPYFRHVVFDSEVVEKIVSSMFQTRPYEQPAERVDN